MKKQDRFLQGYCCCLASIISGHGCNTGEDEAFRTGVGNRTEDELRKAGVDDYDIQIFKNNNLFTNPKED
ncbi:MAG: hypothetical protein P4L31_07280 [Candidatus Babeliales bacterium]|nr:hypothetical protein [Candidatus Babeliales bacterium]